MPLTPPQEAALNAIKAQAQADEQAADAAANAAAGNLRQAKKDRSEAQNLAAMVQAVLDAAQ